MFSGFVKGVDPIGTQYRIADYFIAYHMNWAVPTSLYLSMFLNMFEFSLGVLVLFNVRPRVVSWLVMLMMVFFTFTTFYDALYNPVPDCGCFGDAIKLTNWQTFWKNIIIMVPVIILFYYKKIIRPTFTNKGEAIVTFTVIILFIGFEIYNYRHLPVVDFSKWKVGTRLAAENPQPLKFFVTYKNKETAEEKEFLSPNYPYNDSVWMTRWVFKSQRVVDPNPPSVAISIEDRNRNNVTDNIIRNPNYQFIVVAYDLTLANEEVFQKLNQLSRQCFADGYSLVVITSTLYDQIDRFKKDQSLDENMEFYYADDTSLQGIIRANPGLLLIKNAKVLAKWHWRDLPEYSMLKEKYLK